MNDAQQRIPAKIFVTRVPLNLFKDKQRKQLVMENIDSNLEGSMWRFLNAVKMPIPLSFTNISGPDLVFAE